MFSRIGTKFQPFKRNENKVGNDLLLVFTVSKSGDNFVTVTQDFSKNWFCLNLSVQRTLKVKAFVFTMKCNGRVVNWL